MSGYEILSIHYATHSRTQADNFLFKAPPVDLHDTPMPLDYFLWIVRSPERTVLVDTGFDHPAAQARGRELLRHPVAALRELRIEPETVQDVIITHLHYDHAGNLAAFPNAVFHLQDKEMAYATGRSMTHAPLRQAYDIEDVVTMVRRVYQERVRFHDGEAVLFPGISVHPVPGHTRGLQCVRVATGRGEVVLASDASHFAANRLHANPYPILVDLGAMMESWRHLEALADSEEHIIPGHDGMVIQRYPKHRELPWVNLLHEPPTA